MRPGTHRFSYSSDETMFEKALQLMSRSSRSLYMLQRKRNFCSSVCMSVARPVRPTKVLSFIWKTFCISQPAQGCGGPVGEWGERLVREPAGGKGASPRSLEVFDAQHAPMVWLRMP